MHLKEILSRDEIEKTFGILAQIYENLNKVSYIDDILNMMQRGYRMAAVFEDHENNNCIGVVGIRIIRKLRFSKAVEIEDFMIDRNKRGIGVGKILLKWVDWQALNFKCDSIIGSLQTKRQESQRIFLREKFILEGYSLEKKINKIND